MGFSSRDSYKETIITEHKRGFDSWVRESPEESWQPTAALLLENLMNEAWQAAQSMGQKSQT